jgi:Fe-S-cluster containining protein
MSFEYPRNVRFKCLKCGICCGDTKKKSRHIILLEEEANHIASVTKQPISDFAVKLEGKEPYAYEMKKTSADGKCLFLEENRCRIYANRPIICQFYPFGLETRQNQRAFYFTNECPGVGKGRIMLEVDFQKRLRIASRCAVKRPEIYDLES